MDERKEAMRVLVAGGAVDEKISENERVLAIKVLESELEDTKKKLEAVQITIKILLERQALSKVDVWENYKSLKD